MRLKSLQSSLLLVLLSVTQAYGQDAPRTTICTWSEIRAATVRDALYLDGGNMFLQTADGPTWEFFGNNSASPNTLTSALYTLNYSTAFDIKTTNLTTLFIQYDEGSENVVQSFYNGYMFADAFELYTYGGLTTPSEQQNPKPADYLFGYQLFEGNPGVGIPSLGPTTSRTLTTGVTRYVTNGAGVNIPSEQLGFYLSGYTDTDVSLFNAGTAPMPADQLIEVDMTTFGSPKWTSQSFSKGNDSFIPRADAQLVWIPVGTQGSLIAIGGVVDPEELFPGALNTSQISDSRSISPGFMRNLPIYDIANSAWYIQEVNGKPPGQLTQFCSVVVNETSSAYDIYIYGGYDGLVGTGIYTPAPPSGDVWVLSVPSFTWTRVLQGNATNGRRGHFCTAPYPDQMFVIGGQGQFGDCVDSVIKIFDLNENVWKDSYDPAVYNPSGYQRPSAVASAIAKQPTAVWTDGAIGTLFRTPYEGAPIVKYWPYTSNPPSHPSHIAAIAGGAAAGGACLIVLVLAILWYRRKHKKSPHQGDAEVQPYEQVSRWRRGVAKTDPSVTTTEVEDNSVVNPETGGYYKTAEVPGDERFPHHTPTSPRPGGFAEAGGGTRRISGGQIISPRSPRSPNSGNLGAQEADGEERYEMEVMQSQRGSGDMGARQLFRNHPLYPLSVSDGDGRSQASGPSYSGPSHSYSQASRGEASRHAPSPYLMARPESGLTEDSELPASPVRPNHLQHTRNISSISAAFPQVSPPLEQHATNPMATPPHTSITSEDELDALEAFHTGTPQPFRPSHKRNPSSMSSGINQLPTPSEELTEEEKHRQSTLLAKLPSPLDGTTPVREERNPLLGGGNGGTARGGAVAVGEDVYSPSSYSRGSTLVSPSGRSPVSRKPVGQGSGSGQGLGIERVFSSREGLGEERQTL